MKAAYRNRIKEDYRSRAIGQFRKHEPELRAKLKGKAFLSGRVQIPVIIDGVVDMATYNTKTRRFETLNLSVGVGKGTDPEPNFYPNTAYFDETKTVSVML